MVELKKMPPEMLPLTGAEVANNQMIEFSLKSDVSPEQVESALSSFSDSFNAPLDQKEYELLLNAKTQQGPLGNLMDLFSNGDEIRKQLDIEAFDTKASTDSLPIEKKVALYSSLECMMDDLLQKKVFSGKQRDEVYDLKVDLRKSEQQLIEQWVGEGDADEVVPGFGGSLLTRRQIINASVDVIAALAMTACGISGGQVTSTEAATQVANGPTPIVETLAPTETAAPAPTEAGPSMGNLPEGWAEKIDHIEVMKNMDGTERTVAIERSGDPDKESRLRALQWDADAGEWTPYEPQVGLIGMKAEYWDLELPGGSTSSDDLTGTELKKMLAEPIYGRGGREIPPGLVAEFAEVTLFCGDVIESFPLQNGMLFVIKVPLPNGDIELFQIAEGKGSEMLVVGYMQESMDSMEYSDPTRFGSESIADHLARISQPITTGQVFDYFSDRSASLPWRVVFGVQNTPSVIMAEDVPGYRQRLADKFLRGEVFDQEGIGITFFNYPLFSEESLESIR